MSTTTSVFAISLLETTIRAARFSSGRLEAYREGLLDDRTAVEALLNEATPGWQSSPQLVFALSPSKVFHHFATADQARSNRSRDSIAALAKGLPHGLSEPLRSIACSADGSPIAPKGDSRFLVATAEESSWAKAAEQYPGNLPSFAKTHVASIANFGALASLNEGGSVVALDLGLNQGSLVLISRKGVEGVVALPIGYDTVYEAVQTELGLKFRGSAARLFYNAQYDFSEFGPKIAAKLAPALQSALKSLPTGAASFCVVDLLAGQQWFAKELASSLGLNLWAPDTSLIASRFKLQLPADLAPASINPALVGLLHLGLNGQAAGPWLANWEIGMPDAAPVVVPAAVRPPAPAPAPAPAPVAAKPAAPAPAKPVAIPVAPQKQPEPVKPAEAERKTPSLNTPKPAPAQQQVPVKAEAVKVGAPKQDARLEAVKKEPVKAEPKPEPKAEAPKPQPKPASTVAYPGTEKKKTNPALYIGLAAAVVIILGGAYLFSTLNETKAKAEQDKIALQKQVEQREQAAKLAEQKAREDAERTRRDAEAKAADAIAKARADAEELVKNVRAEEKAKYLAEAPGVLLITTDPSGASVVVDSSSPVNSPVTRTDLKSGKHHVRITHPGYDVLETDIDITALRTTDMGMLKLVRQAGDLAVTSSPSGMDYIVSLNGEIVSQGKTPASVENLPLGEYVVTVQRPGWNRSTQTVSLVKGSVQRISADFPTGTVLVQSIPSNADVLRNGVKIGVTPLRLTELTPGRIELSLDMKGYDRTQILGEIVAGREVTLSTEMLDPNRIVKSSEVRQQPEAVERITPLKPVLDRKYGRVVISAIIRKDGSVNSVKVDSSADAEWGRICAEAVANWKFKPGLDASGRPVNVKVSIPLADN